MKHKKKAVKKYEQFVLRIPTGHEDTFEELKNIIDRLHVHYKTQQEDEEETIKKNAIILEALTIGLNKMLKKEKLS